MHVKRKTYETFKNFMTRYKRKLKRSGILSECRQRRFYVKPSQKRRNKKNAAARRHKKTTSNKGS